MQWCDQDPSDRLHALRPWACGSSDPATWAQIHTRYSQAVKSEHCITKDFGVYSALPELAEWLKANHFTSPCLVFPFYLNGDSNTYLPTSQRCCEAEFISPWVLAGSEVNFQSCSWMESAGSSVDVPEVCCWCRELYLAWLDALVVNVDLIICDFLRDLGGKAW